MRTVEFDKTSFLVSSSGLLDDIENLKTSILKFLL